MATLSIGGQKYKIDGFDSLSPEQQEETINEIASSQGTQAQEQPEQQSGSWQDWFAGLGQQAANRGIGFSRTADDLTRLGLNAATFGFADKAVAGLTPSTVEQERAATQSARDRQGLLGTGAELAGGMAVPFAAASRGASLLGRFGTNAMTGIGGVAARTGLAATEGAGYGVLDALGNDRSLAGGAALGAVGGSAGNLIGEGVGAVARSLRSPLARAQEYIAQRGLYDNLTPDDAAARLSQLGDDAVLADLGSNLQGAAGAVAASPGQGRDIVTRGLTDRQAGANARLRGELDSTLGVAPIPSVIDEGIEASQRALSPEYGAALSNSRAVDTSQLANKLDADIVQLRGKAQKVSSDVRRMLNVTGADQLDPNPATLLQVRQAIDGMLSSETDSSARRALALARQSVDDTLTNAVPGIKEIDAQYAELARQRDALSTGQQVLDSGRTSLRPQELEQMVTQGALPQGASVGPSAVPTRLQQGARAEIERIVGTNSNDRAALQRLIKGEGDWNRSRLNSLFGKAKTDRIINVIENEVAKQATYNTALGNSVTAARSAAMADLPGNTTTDNVLTNLLDLRGGQVLRNVLGGAFGEGMQARNNAANAEIARLLMSRDASAFQPVVPSGLTRDSIVRALIGATGYIQ